MGGTRGHAPAPWPDDVTSLAVSILAVSILAVAALWFIFGFWPAVTATLATLITATILAIAIGAIRLAFLIMDYLIRLRLASIWRSVAKHG